MRLLLLLISLTFAVKATTQTNLIKGTVTDAITNEPIGFANIFLMDTDRGTVTDENGNYEIQDLTPGLYNVRASFIGYAPRIESEISLSSSRPTVVNFKLESSSSELEEVIVKAESFRKTEESPLSLRTIGVTEIKRSPGGNRDISVVIQSFPGVTSASSFRNDLIIRGGAPNENRFYLDDVEIPNINHFSTQGASGGPAGILNVDFIREVDFYSGAFPANRNNALSSVFNFKQKDGRDDKMGFTATVGASDIGMTLEGPLSSKTTFLASARRSYLQFLFSAIGLPFLPTYNDFNVKVKTKFNQKNELTFIGVGAIDKLVLNLDSDDTELKQFSLARLPYNDQWTYTNGLVYKHYRDNGFTTYVLSRNMINFEAYKYLDNNEDSEDNLIFDYLSQEIENHARVENTDRYGDWKLNYGLGADFVRYNNRTFNKIFTSAGPEEINYSSELDFLKYSGFGQVSRSILQDRLTLSAGINVSGNSYSDEMANPLKQFSPRLSATYTLSPSMSLNFNTGIYHQLPAYTILGYRENGVLVNEDIKPITNNHIVFGVEYQSPFKSQITLEGYIKDYKNYPFLIRDSLTLANLGGDFGIVGNEPAISKSDGRTYGVELMYQQRLYKGFYGIASYTFGMSEFEDKNGDLIPSSWDARHASNITLGKKFKKNWEVGVKWRIQTGLPFTPDSDNSNLVINWDRNAGAYPNYDQLNTLRSDGSSEIDLRVDKKWFFSGWSLELYLDVQNVTGSSISRNTQILDVELDADEMPIGEPVILNPQDAPIDQRYKTKFVTDDSGTVLPTIGIVIQI